MMRRGDGRRSVGAAARVGDLAPRLYYGWVLLGAVSVTETVSWGILYYAFSVFLAPMQRDLGWSRTDLTGAFSLALLLAGVAALPVGRWLDAHGPRPVMTLGSIAAALLLLAWAAVRSLPLFYLVWAGLGLAMAAVFYEPAFVLVANWFVRGRTRALTILTFVGGLASVVFIPLAAWLVRAHGWRMALVALAVILALTTIPPHALLLRRRPRDLGLTPDGADAAPSAARTAPERSVAVGAALRQRTFWWLTLAFVLTMLANVALTVHLIPYLNDRGYGAGFAATAAGLVGLAALPGRLIFTPLGGRVSRPLVTAAIFLLQAVAIVALLRLDSTAGVLLFVLLFGAGFGAITPARAALVADLYGAAAYGRINGVLALGVALARAAAPLGLSLAVTHLGGYRPALWALAAVSTLAAVAVVLAGSDRTWSVPEASAGG